MAKIGIILNTNAGSNNGKAELGSAFRQAVGRDGLVVVTDSIAELPHAAAQFAERGIEVLAVCGGDGSFSHGLSACLPVFGDALPYFLPLPAGSMNTAAKGLGWRPGGLADAVAAAAEAQDLSRSRFRVVEREVLCANDSIYGFMVGAGVIVNFLSAYYSRPGRGPLAASRLAVHMIGSMLTGGALAKELFAPVNGRVQCDEYVLPWDRFRMIFAATVPELGLGFRVAHLAGTEPGRFHLVAGDPPVGKLVQKLPQLLRGLPTGADRLHDALCDRSSVQFDAPSAFMVDGDIHPAVSRLDINLGPRLRILI